MKRIEKPKDAELLFDRHHLIQLLWPLVVEQLLSVLVGMVDVMMVAYVGEAAVSGVSLVDSVAAGGTVVCAQSIGSGDYKLAGKSGGQLLFMTTSVMLFISAAFLLQGNTLLSVIFGTVDRDVMEDAVKYLAYTSASFPFLAVYYSAAAIFRAAGNTKLSMLASLGMNLLNIIGNAICIFGFHMGVARTDDCGGVYGVRPYAFWKGDPGRNPVTDETGSRDNRKNTIHRNT